MGVGKDGTPRLLGVGVRNIPRLELRIRKHENAGIREYIYMYIYKYRENARTL